MEYLTIQGSVVIDENKPAVKLMCTIQQLMAIEFNKTGFADYTFDMDTMHLSLFVEGPVSEETTDRVKQQLDQLRYYLAPGSQIVVVRERWAVNVVLSCLSRRSKPIARVSASSVSTRPFSH